MIVTGYRSRNRVLGQLTYACDKCGKSTYHTLTENSPPQAVGL